MYHLVTSEVWWARLTATINVQALQQASEPQTPPNRKAEGCAEVPNAPRKAGRWQRQLSPTAPVRKLDFDAPGPVSTRSDRQPD